MKLLILFIAAFTAQLAGTAFGTDYNTLAVQGYRWVIVNGPYACTTEDDVARIVARHTDAAELDVIQNVRCYYLIPGALAQVISEDRSRGMSEIRLGWITTPLWTYTRFLSRSPVADTYGVIETPNNGVAGTGNTATIPKLQSDSTDWTGKNENP